VFPTTVCYYFGTPDTDSSSRPFNIHLARDRRPGLQHRSSRFLADQIESRRATRRGVNASPFFRASYGNTERRSVDCSRLLAAGVIFPTISKRQMGGDRCGRFFIPFIFSILSRVQRLLGANLLANVAALDMRSRVVEMRKKIAGSRWGFRIFSSRRKVLSERSQSEKRVRKRRVHRGAASRASLDRFRFLGWRLEGGGGIQIYISNEHSLVLAISSATRAHQTRHDEKMPMI